jgi:hypothetical protein
MDNPNEMDHMFRKVVVEELSEIAEKLIPEFLAKMDQLFHNSAFLGLERPDALASLMQAINFVFSTVNIGTCVGYHTMLFGLKDIKSADGFGDPESTYSKLRVVHTMLMSYLCFMTISKNTNKSFIQEESVQRSMDEIMDTIKEIINGIQ